MRCSSTWMLVFPTKKICPPLHLSSPSSWVFHFHYHMRTTKPLLTSIHLLIFNDKFHNVIHITNFLLWHLAHSSSFILFSCHHTLTYHQSPKSCDEQFQGYLWHTFLPFVKLYCHIFTPFHLIGHLVFWNLNQQPLEY